MLPDDFLRLSSLVVKKYPPQNKCLLWFRLLKTKNASTAKCPLSNIELKVWCNPCAVKYLVSSVAFVKNEKTRTEW